VWGCSKLHCNELYYIIPKLSFTRSVFSICLYIQPHKYVCNVSQIWLFLLETLESIFKNPILYYYNITFCSCWSRTTLLSNADRDVRFKSLTTTMFMIMTSSKNESIFICNLSDRAGHINFDAWWDSMNVGSKWHISSNNSRHAPSWQFYLYCGVEKTGSPGIMCIIWHWVLRHPSDHGTSSIENHLLRNTHITKSNTTTEFQVAEFTRSTVDETDLAMPGKTYSVTCNLPQAIWSTVTSRYTDNTT